MSERKPSWAGLALVQVSIVAVLIALYMSPRVRIAGLGDAPEATVFRWLRSDQRSGKKEPRIEPFEGGFGIRHPGRGKDAYALDDPRLESLDPAQPMSVTAIVRPEGNPTTRGVIIAAQRADDRIFEIGLNRHNRAYVELRPDAKPGPLLTPDSERLPGETTFIAVVYVPGERLSIYLDGALSMELTGKQVPVSLGAQLEWWASNRKGTKNVFPGVIGTLSIYPRALSSEEIAAEVERAGLEVNAQSFPPKRLPEKKRRKKRRKKAEKDRRRSGSFGPKRSPAPPDPASPPAD